MALSVGKVGNGNISDPSYGKTPIGEITLGQNVVWKKKDPYVPGVMVLTIETTKPNQIVNLGYNLGRWQNKDKVAQKIPHYGTVNWGDDSEEYEFNGKEGIKEEDNLLVHTYTVPSTYEITIKGVVKWDFASQYSIQANTICQVLKHIKIPEEEISPIYYINERAFTQCTSLETIDARMFENCTEVTNFNSCFYDCTSLNTLPKGLFDKCTQITNLSNCFRMTKISKIPEGLFDNCIQLQSLDSCFSSTKITEIPPTIFEVCGPHLINLTGCFCGCPITKIPEGLFDTCVNVTMFGSWEGCFSYTKITEIPPDLFKNCTKVTNFSMCFMRCKQLTEIPEGLFDHCPNVTSFSNVGFGCFYETSITKIPEHLFDHCPNVTTFAGCFYNCSKVEGELPELWTTHPNATNHTKCFYNCTNASNYEQVPEDWR